MRLSFLLILFFSWNLEAIHFVCNDGHTVSMEEICDGKENCKDGTDEKTHLCHRSICPLDTFRCHYGACISRSLVCNGVKNCADGSDESECGKKLHTCSSIEYKCSSGECIPVSKLCDGISDCKGKNDEGEICKKMSVCPPSTHRCNIGSCILLTQLCDGRKDCIDGSDEFENLCAARNCTDRSCKKKANIKYFCPAISSPRINARCMIPSGANKGIISCNVPLPAGTVVHYECKPYYLPATFKDKNNRAAFCQKDGNWNRELLRCTFDCGLEESVTPLIVKGWIATRNRFPWHVVLYALEEGKWIFICGATLITETIVLTAAHCVWQIPKGFLQLAFGKYYSDFYRTETSAQFRNISEIIIQPAYQDATGNYESDIAILVLENFVQFSESIRPICVDWNLNHMKGHLTENSKGLVVGMGATEHNAFSKQLRGTYLSVKNNSYCIENQKRDFKKYIRYTSFCAGWNNGTGVCNGDSGGGIVFPSKENPRRFMIQGIVSVSPRRPGTSMCDTNYYTVFTKVGLYVKWIRDTIRKFHSNTKYALTL